MDGGKASTMPWHLREKLPEKYIVQISCSLIIIYRESPFKYFRIIFGDGTYHDKKISSGFSDHSDESGLAGTDGRG